MYRAVRCGPHALYNYTSLKAENSKHGRLGIDI